MKQLRIFVKPLVLKFCLIEKKKAESGDFDAVKSLWPSVQDYILAQVQKERVHVWYDDHLTSYSEQLYLEVPDEFYLKYKDVPSGTLLDISRFIENIFDKFFLIHTYSHVNSHIIYSQLPDHVKVRYGITKRMKAIDFIRQFRNMYGITETELKEDTMYRKYKRFLAKEEKTFCNTSEKQTQSFRKKKNYKFSRKI